MKIKLSKAQWEQAGQKAGWMKESQKGKEETKPCPHCKGSGLIYHGTTKCEKCHGTGKISIDTDNW
jgi:uncharacterized phage protein